MNNYTANYLWNFKPSESSPMPMACIDNNKKFFGQTKILSPEDIEPLLMNYPELQKQWQKIPHWIIKADLGRLLYVYCHGGFYFDVDCKIRKNIPAKQDRFMVLFTETILKNVNKLGPKECKNPENVLRVANFAFGTNVIRHPFLHEVILECSRRLQLLIDPGNAKPDHLDILWVCGPDVITSVFHLSGHRYPDLVLLDTSYLSHLCHGSWRD